MTRLNKPVSKRELLAHTIADALGDSKRADIYSEHCKELPLSSVLRAYNEAKSFQLDRIRKARPALFFYLINRFENERK